MSIALAPGGSDQQGNAGGSGGQDGAFLSARRARPARGIGGKEVAPEMIARVISTTRVASFISAGDIGRFFGQTAIILQALAQDPACARKV